MDNDSQLSNLSSSEIFAVKPQVYEFGPHLPENTNQIRFNNSLTVRVAPNIQQIHWKPKLPSKKLFEDPKFLLSIERKKVRVINGLRDSSLEATELQRNQFKSERIRIKKEQPPRTRRSLKDEQPHGYIHSHLNNSQKTRKTPLVNFNLQHLIKQRKSFKTDQSGPKKKGSNDPYYSFITSDRFELNTRGDHQQMLQSRSRRPTTRAIRTTKTGRVSHSSGH